MDKAGLKRTLVGDIRLHQWGGSSNLVCPKRFP
jgi:hypothetical protein